MPSRIDAWSSSVIWMSSTAVNAWFAGLAAITWYSVVPSSPHPVSMRCDPANTPSSYGWTSSSAQTPAYPWSPTSVAVSAVYGTASKMTPGTSNVPTKPMKSGAAEIHGSSPAGAVSTSIHELGTPTVIVAVSSVRITKSGGITTPPSGVGGSVGGGAAKAGCPVMATAATGRATARASRVVVFIGSPRFVACRRHVDGGCCHVPATSGRVAASVGDSVADSPRGVA